MRINIYDNKLVITEIKSFHFQFDLYKNIDKKIYSMKLIIL